MAAPPLLTEPGASGCVSCVMRVVLSLTVQPPEGRDRFFRYMTETRRAPSVGDYVDIGRYPNTSPGSSAISATVTAVTWPDLTFEEAVVSLHTSERLVSLETLSDGDHWVDEDPE